MAAVISYPDESSKQAKKYTTEARKQTQPFSVLTLPTPSPRPACPGPLSQLQHCHTVFSPNRRWMAAINVYENKEMTEIFSTVFTFIGYKNKWDN